MKLIIDKSPNFSRGTRSKKQVKFVIIHYTGMQSEIESLKRLKNPNSKVSCHYFINRKGKIIQMVKENRVAWHAGKSKWKNFINLNQNSLGIELENKGHQYGYQNFSNLQIMSLINLCKKLKKKYKLNKRNFLGHSDIAPLRKIDPGEKFPWTKLNKYNLGLKYNIRSVGPDFIKKKYYRRLFFQNLKKIGYRYFDISRNNSKDKLIIKSFQQHFLPKKITGKIDEKTLKISYFLAKERN
tara:strand:+ start:1496 stop:2215 length:720 start_codon:yes stop_codon:yes gene_type:complete